MDLSRHISYFNHALHGKPVTIIGAGATGSRVFEALINLGLRDITVYDDDDVEDHNIANQLYAHRDIGETKVSSAYAWSRDKCEEDIHKMPSMVFRHERVVGNMRNDMSPIVFLLTDTMESRREIMSNSLQLNPKVELVIETRMAISHGNINMLNPNMPRELAQWSATLIDDDAGEESACGTSLTIGTTANIIANLAVNMMMNYLITEDKRCVDHRMDIMLNPMGVHVSNWER